MKRRSQRATNPEQISDEAAHETTKQMAGAPTLDGLTAVASGGAVLTRRGLTDLQRLAGNMAARSLVKADRAASPAMRTLQRQAEEERGKGVQSAKGPVPSAPEEAWEGSIKGHLGENISLLHTLNNYGDEQLRYVLRIHSRGYAMVSLETRYRINNELREPWVALYAQRGETREVINGLPPRSSLHLRFFGERDATQKDQSYFEGTVEVRRRT
jgi:hypothetical protein